MTKLKVREWESATSKAVLDLQQLVANAPKTPELQPVAKAFCENIRRVSLLAQISPTVFYEGRRFQQAEIAAFLELTGKPGPESADAPRPSNLDVTRGEILKGDMASPLPMEIPWVSLADLSATTGIPLASWFHSLMSFQLVGMWTAFETLAGDLWKAAVNAHPVGLANLDGKRKGLPAGKADPGKTIPLGLLANRNYQLRSAMGDLLVETKKVDFTTLDSIREAYAAAFGNSLPPACALLGDSAIDALSILRNLIVHKSGICDKEYLDKSHSFSQLPVLREGEQFEPDGDLMAGLFVPATNCCVKLICVIDDWLEKPLGPPGDGVGI